MLLLLLLNEAVTLSKTTTTLASTPPRFWAPELSNLIYIHFACVAVVDFSLSFFFFFLLLSCFCSMFARCNMCLHSANTVLCGAASSDAQHNFTKDIDSSSSKVGCKVYLIFSPSLLPSPDTHAQHLHCQSLGKRQFGSFFFFSFSLVSSNVYCALSLRVSAITVHLFL